MSRNFSIPADGEDEEEKGLKYKVGQFPASLKEIENRTPVFAYDYLSLKRTNFCFNNSTVTSGDYQYYFQVINRISKMTIGELWDSKGNDLHFHRIKIEEKRDLQEKIKRALNINKITYTDFPMIAQFGIYTQNPTIVNAKAPRVIFLIGNYGVFHILFLDYEHQTYQKKF